jgi:hypothetical protein
VGRVHQGTILANFVEELHKRLGSPCTDPCGSLFGGKQKILDPRVVSGSLGKSFCDNGWLVELDAKTEVDQWVKKAWLGRSLLSA